MPLFAAALEDSAFAIAGGQVELHISSIKDFIEARLEARLNSEDNP